MATYLLIGPQEVPPAAKMTALGISALLFVSFPILLCLPKASPIVLFGYITLLFTASLASLFSHIVPSILFPRRLPIFLITPPEFSPRVQPPARGIARSNDITLQPVGQKASVSLISQLLPQWPRPMKSRRGKESETAHQCT